MIDWGHSWDGWLTGCADALLLTLVGGGSAAWVEGPLVDCHQHQFGHSNPGDGCGHGLMGGRDFVELFFASYADGNCKPLHLVGHLGWPDVQPIY